MSEDGRTFTEVDVERFAKSRHLRPMLWKLFFDFCVSKESGLDGVIVIDHFDEGIHYPNRSSFVCRGCLTRACRHPGAYYTCQGGHGLIANSRHVFGEADLAMVYWAYVFRSQASAVVISTTDTDQLPILVQFLDYMGYGRERDAYKPELYWHYGGRHVNMKTLFRGLTSRLGLTPQEFVYMCIMCGTDYAFKGTCLVSELEPPSCKYVATFPNLSLTLSILSVGDVWQGIGATVAFKAMATSIGRVLIREIDAHHKITTFTKLMIYVYKTKLGMEDDWDEKHPPRLRDLERVLRTRTSNTMRVPTAENILFFFRRVLFNKAYWNVLWKDAPVPALCFRLCSSGPTIYGTSGSTPGVRVPILTAATAARALSRAVSKRIDDSNSSQWKRRKMIPPDAVLA